MIRTAVSGELIASGNCQEHMEEFKRENVAVIARPVDPSEKAKKMRIRVNAAFRLPFGLRVSEDAARKVTRLDRPIKT